MAVQNFRKDYVYRYRLSEHYKGDSMQIAGYNLSKEWTDYKTVKEELNSFIHTPANLQGILDFEKKDLLANEVVQQSKWEGEIPEIISRETLHVMERYELVPVAQYYRIDCVNRDAKMLVKLIIDSQNKRIEFEQSNETEKENIKNQDTNIIINHNEQNPQQYFNEDDIERKNGWFGFGSKK